MPKYDEKYREVILKLNEAFSQKKDDELANFTAHDKMDAEKQKLIEEIPSKEIRKIGAKVRSNIVDIGYLTKEENHLLEEIKKGRKNKCKQAVYRLVGNVDVEQIMEKYTEFLKEDPIFRTAYLYKGLEKPVRVVCETRESVFPIHDISNLNHDQQMLFVKNVIAAQMRRDYDIESGCVMGLQGFLTSGNEMMVLVSIYPHMPYDTGVRAMISKIFNGMETQSAHMSVDEKMVQRMNEELRLKSIAYWKKLLLPLGKRLTIPGECRKSDEYGRGSREQTFLYKELDEGLVKNLAAFLVKNKVSVKAVFLLTWGNLMGRYHDEKTPLMLVAQNGERMNLFPVKIIRDQTAYGNLNELDSQIKESVNHSNCTIQDMEAAAGIIFPEYFRMVHCFVNFSELDELEAGRRDVAAINGISADDTDINLFINYRLYGSSIGIYYIAKTDIMELVLDNLHDLFVNELSLLLSVKNTKFDKRSFIKVTDTEEEKMYKIQLAQIGLYLKQSGLFETMTADEVMKLAEYCKLATYLANDTVVTEKRALSKIYILGDGMMEETMIAMDGMVRTLRMVESGSVFGVESLLSKERARTSYTVVSSQAKVVEIEKEILEEVFRRKTDGWTALLERENEQKFRYQRLWTME
ncbi:MAG: condensation domain-containing protein [Clostridiales bacterium]|nr:condensation domain-containing protein [Clostridiales bacterium]